MRILVIHNRYQQTGGEDSVFKAETALLINHGNVVESLLFDNTVIKTFFDKCISGLFSIYNPASARTLKNRILRFHPDVIHVHNFLPLASPSVFFVAKRMKVPIILTLHNYRLICPSATLFFKGAIYEKSIHSIFPFNAIWKGVYRDSRIQTAIVALMTLVHHFLGTWKNKVDYYITLTAFAKAKFVTSTLSVVESKFLVKPNFVNDFGERGVERRDFFLFIGRLTEEKGIRVLLQAAVECRFKLVVMGDGPLRGLVQDAEKKNLNIQYIGQQPQAVVIEYLKKCKALIFPSIWYEGFPMTILEAFSACTVVIASNMGGMQEIIQDGKNGLVFNPGDAYDLGLKINEINKNYDLAKAISKNARLTYLEKYTPAKNYERMEQIYHRAMGQKGNWTS